MTNEHTHEQKVATLASASAHSMTLDKPRLSPGQRLHAWRVGLLSLVGLLVLGLIPTLYDQIFGASSGFELHNSLTLIGILAIAALAQNVLTGYTAQPSLGNAAFFGVSAYLLTWLTSDLHQPYWVGVVVAVLASALLGIVVGGPALRISGAYLAIATLGLVTIAGALLNLWDTTAGRQNYDLNNLPTLLSDDHALYYVVCLLLVTIIFLVYHLLRARVGRAWVAIRENETAAEAFGINLTKYKLQAFVISAALTGLAGVLYTTWATTASSSMSSLDQTIAFLTMIIVGGLGSITGSILGAIFVGFLPLLLGQLPSPLVVGSFQIQVSTLDTGIYGLLLLLALIFFPTGLSSVRTVGANLLKRLNKRGGVQ